MAAASAISALSRSRMRAIFSAWSGFTGSRSATPTRSVITPPTVSIASTPGFSLTTSPQDRAHGIHGRDVGDAAIAARDLEAQRAIEDLEAQFAGQFGRLPAPRFLCGVRSVVHAGHYVMVNHGESYITWVSIGYLRFTHGQQVVRRAAVAAASGHPARPDHQREAEARRPAPLRSVPGAGIRSGGRDGAQGPRPAPARGPDRQPGWLGNVRR